MDTLQTNCCMYCDSDDFVDYYDLKVHNECLREAKDRVRFLFLLNENTEQFIQTVKREIETKFLYEKMKFFSIK